MQKFRAPAQQATQLTTDALYRACRGKNNMATTGDSSEANSI